MLRRPRPFDHGFVTEHYDVIIVGSGAGGGTLAIRVGEHLVSQMS
jgi:succinate dehydrogenase/fumarate reductase flavoprotein subunit